MDMSQAHTLYMVYVSRALYRGRGRMGGHIIVGGAGLGRILY